MVVTVTVTTWVGQVKAVAPNVASVNWLGATKAIVLVVPIHPLASWI